MDGFQPARHLGQHVRAGFDVATVHLVRPNRAGVIHIGVDIARGERVEDNAGAEAVAALCRETMGRQPLLHQTGQHILFGERLGANHVSALRAA